MTPTSQNQLFSDRPYVASENYNTYALNSNLGTIDTTAALLGGEAAAARTLTANFSSTATASNDANRKSDVFHLTGGDSDIMTIQLTLVTGVTADDYLGWLDGGEWVNAIDGNSTVGGSALQGFNGSYAASGISSTSDYLGSWGYDTAGGSVWAVVDHNSAFAIIPEPGSAILLGLGLLGVTLVTRRRNTVRWV